MVSLLPVSDQVHLLLSLFFVVGQWVDFLIKAMWTFIKRNGSEYVSFSIWSLIKKTVRISWIEVILYDRVTLRTVSSLRIKLPKPLPFNCNSGRLFISVEVFKFEDALFVVVVELLDVFLLALHKSSVSDFSEGLFVELWVAREELVLELKVGFVVIGWLSVQLFYAFLLHLFFIQSGERSFHLVRFNLKM